MSQAGNSPEGQPAPPGSGLEVHSVAPADSPGCGGRAGGGLLEDSCKSGLKEEKSSSPVALPTHGGFAFGGVCSLKRKERDADDVCFVAVGRGPGNSPSRACAFPVQTDACVGNWLLSRAQD